MYKDMFQFLTVAVLILLGYTAQAQTQTDNCPYPWSEVVNCTTAEGDPICDFQRQNGLTQNGHCDRATALKLAEKFLETQGAWTTTTDAQAWAICSATGPRRSDGKCGWFRIVDEGTPAAGGSGEGPIKIVANNLAANRKATNQAYEEARQAGRDEAAYKCAVNNVLGLPCLELVVFGPAVGVANLGWFTGAQLALHIPVTNWSYRSGVELGASGGYAGREHHGDHIVDRGQLGPFAQLVLMPWRRVAVLAGGQYDHRFPGQALDPEDYLGGRFGFRFYLADWLALDFLGTVGGVRKDNADWSGAGGGAAALQVHF